MNATLKSYSVVLVPILVLIVATLGAALWWAPWGPSEWDAEAEPNVVPLSTTLDIAETPGTRTQDDKAPEVVSSPEPALEPAPVEDSVAEAAESTDVPDPSTPPAAPEDLAAAQQEARAEQLARAWTLLEQARDSLEKNLRAFAAMQQRHREWLVTEARITEQLRLQREWRATGYEIAALADYLDDSEWCLRAIGVEALASFADPRGLAELVPALKDKSPFVRAFALTALNRTPVWKIQRSGAGALLVETVIEEMSRRKQLRVMSNEFLTRLAGTNHKTKTRWKRWWKDHRQEFDLEAERPFDLAQFGEADLDRFHGERGRKKAPTRGRTAVVEEVEEVKATFFEIRRFGLDVVICLDVTGSMGGVLAEAQEKVEELRSILTSLVGNFRIGLVTYRDTVAAQVPLTKNWNAYREQLFAQSATGGGDGPEGVEKAVKVALSNKMGWRRRAASRSIVIVGDAPPHDEDLAEFEQLGERAKKFEIPIHALYPSVTVREIEKVVKQTGGESTSVASDSAFLKSFLLLVFDAELEPYLDSFIDTYFEVAEHIQPK